MQKEESARRIAQQKKVSARREARQVPNNTARAFRKAGGHTIVKDRSAPGRSGALPPPVRDDGGQTCHECGVEGDATEQRQFPDALEPDCKNPGRYYCLNCWQQWDRGDIEDEGDDEDVSETVAAVNYKSETVAAMRPMRCQSKLTPRYVWPAPIVHAKQPKSICLPHLISHTSPTIHI